MRIQPDSTITLYQNVPIDEGEQLVFASAANRERYFQNHRALHGIQTPVTVVRKNGALRVELNPNGLSGAILSQCNYLSFINPSFDNKIIYARIVDYDYVNNEVAEINYAIDYWLTWMFDVEFSPCYIEREHISQTEFVTQNQNPYDPSLFMMRTPEPSLAISKDLEKPFYVIDDGTNPNNDGYMMGLNLVDSQDVPDGVGTLLAFSEIDLEDLDAQWDEEHPGGLPTDRPSFKWAQAFNNAIIDTMGFYRMTHPTYKYLNSKYPSVISSRTGAGGYWSNTTPCSSSKILDSLGCNYIYFGCETSSDPSVVSSQAVLTNLLNTMTAQSCLSSIIGMWAIPTGLIALSGEDRTSDLHTAALQRTAKIDLQSYTSKKLLHYPFSYLRLISPNNDVLELHYEDFETVQNGDDECYVLVTMDISDRPSIIAAPYLYKMSTDNIGGNILEGMVYEQFPTKPYNIDSFLAQVAANANAVIASRTIDAAYDMGVQKEMTQPFMQNSQMVEKILGGAANVGLSLATGGVSKLRGTASGAGFFSDVYGTSVEQAAERGKFENAANKWTSATNVLSGKDSAIVDDLRQTRPAYACNKYVKSNGTGMLNFNKLSFFDLIYMRVSLRPDILARYDEYFKLYGYASGRCGIPHVVDYMGAPSASADPPEWVTFNNKQITYVKTRDCKIRHSMLPVAEAIRNMFNNGIRLIKGDLS